MEKYILSEIFTLIPQELYTAKNGETALKEQFSLKEGYIYNGYKFSCANAVVAFALPFSKEDQASGNQEGSGTGADTMYPFIVRMLNETAAIDSFNKVIFHYSKEKTLAHIVISAGEELRIANCFKADTFESALYFLFLTIQQLQMNPKQCIVRICSDITPEQEQIMVKFFNGVEKNNLSKIICTL